jgi:hypothetical protein
MELVAQTLDDILSTLRPLTVEWQDDVSRRVTVQIEALPVKDSYTVADVRKLLDNYFDDGSQKHFERKMAKCDFAIPSKSSPRILIESKGYGATGSKMTDIIGDIEKIIAAKRPDTAFLFFTDGLTWKQRKSDLRKIVEYQNEGDITRIYTYAMANQFEADLRQLKQEYGL